MKYTCLNPIAACGLDLLPAGYEKTEELADANIVLVRSAAMHDLDLPEGLLAVARAGAGVNNIPLDKCAENGIVVFNSPGANANGVKELVLAGMLLACRDIVGGIGWVKDNKDDEGIGKAAEKAKKAFAGTEILGKKLGVLGMGAIGVKVANAAVALGMEVIGYDPYLPAASKAIMDDSIKIVETPDEIYESCDFITVHVPLMDATRGMISADAIAKMKDTAVVLNFSRDTLVDEAAMVEALAAGKIRKYVVDFPSAITAGKDGCIVIPHLGASTAESEDNCAIMAANEITAYIEKGNIINSVNYPALDAGDPAGTRICVLSKAIDGAADVFKGICPSASAVVSNTRGDYAYTVIDGADASCADAVKGVDGVIRVRVIG